MRSMMRLCCTVVMLWVLLSLAGKTSAQEVSIQDNYFFIDGKKVFLKATGFEVGALPGELPWERTFRPEQLQFDIERILEAGFNTIRTWAPFTEEELNLLDQYDIYIIMGIWIDPHGDFSDEDFVAEARGIVSDVMSYARYHDRIIAYLIMNEPLPETIFEAGYNETVGLWEELINIIHDQHPGRPVSIANTCNGTYIDTGIFDFSAYNVYIYNPVTVNYLHQYPGYIEYLSSLTLPGQPLVITEFGLSVSPSGPGNWGYGGNSLTEQQEGVLHMYEALVNGGATGACVFNYSDGWWKAGNEFVHDDAAEEWFGLIEYAALSDSTGLERPVWDAVKTYQSAILTQPRSGNIYVRKVPLEVFANEGIDRVEVAVDEEMIYTAQVQGGYLADTLYFGAGPVTDLSMVFNFLDADGVSIKQEEKKILLSNEQMPLPAIEIFTNDDFWETGIVTVTYQVTKKGPFTSSGNLDHVFYPHRGFDYGQKFQTSLPPGNTFTLTRSYNVSSITDVFTLGAAFDIYFNDFRKRIVNQATFTRPEEASSLAESDRLSARLTVYPNPAKEYFKVGTSGTGSSGTYDYEIVTPAGTVVQRGSHIDWSASVSTSALKPGIYGVRIRPSGRQERAVKKIAVL